MGPCVDRRRCSASARRHRPTLDIVASARYTRTIPPSAIFITRASGSVVETRASVARSGLPGLVASPPATAPGLLDASQASRRHALLGRLVQRGRRRPAGESAPLVSGERRHVCSVSRRNEPALALPRSSLGSATKASPALGSGLSALVVPRRRRRPVRATGRTPSRPSRVECEWTTDFKGRVSYGDGCTAIR